MGEVSWGFVFRKTEAANQLVLFQFDSSRTVELKKNELAQEMTLQMLVLLLCHATGVFALSSGR